MGRKYKERKFSGRMEAKADMSLAGKQDKKEGRKVTMDDEVMVVLM